MYQIKFSFAIALLFFGTQQQVLAQVPRMGNFGDFRGAVVIGVPSNSIPGVDPGPTSARPGSFKRLSDSTASCVDIANEVNSLETKIAQYIPQINAAQSISQSATDAMMASGSGEQAISTATGILSMVPGAGLFAGVAGGIASSAAAASANSNMQAQSSKMMKAQQDLMELNAAMSNDQGRRDYLVDLYLAKSCKLDLQRK